MDEIIEEVENVTIVCYANTAVHNANKKDKLKLMFHSFNTTRKLDNISNNTLKGVKMPIITREKDDREDCLLNI